jgi:glycosyltransferase involved in cell wall biosynthesis
MEKKKEMKENKIKLSACLILKNEGKTIYRCLDSIKDVVDEYIIGIDESTDDNTREEAERFLKDIDDDRTWGVIYGYKWDNDFSKARNEGMDKATGDYILIMDGHEYFPESHYNITAGREMKCQELLKKAKQYLADNPHDQGYVQLYQQPFNGIIPNNFFLQPRFYRNGYARDYKRDGYGNIDLNDYKEDKTKKIRFGRAAHNTIQNIHLDSTVSFDEIILIHDAPDDNRKERKVQRKGMNIDELKKMIEKNKDDYRAMFYLGNTYMEDGQYKKAINTFARYIKNVKGDHSEKYQSLLHKAICHEKLEEWGDARDSLLLATGIDPLRRDAMLLLGDLYFKLKYYEKALKYYTDGMNIIPKPSRMFQNGGACTFDFHQKLAFTYASMGMIHKAIVHLEQAYKFFPNEKWAEQIKIWQDGKVNILIIDRGGSFTPDFVEHLKRNNKYNVLVNHRYDTRLATWAHFIWAEWANDDAYLCSKNFPKKTVIRMHGWEAYGLEKLHKQIAWNKCKKTVFVCEHIREKMLEKGVVRPDKTEMIYNGVNTEKFFIKEEKRDPKNVGFAGFLNMKKNPMLLFRIIRKNPDYTFHLRISHQDPYYKAVMDHELKDCKNVVIHDWYNDLSDFWNQMSIVLSPSIIESFSYNVAEAMACGCKPYIYNWIGADRLWKKEWIFDDMPEFTKDIDIKEREKYRDYIIKNYPLDDSLIKMEKVLVE